MKLWLLRPTVEEGTKDTPWHYEWDMAYGFVVRAKTEDEARKLVVESEWFGDEGSEAWLNPVWSSCEPLTTKGPAEIIIRDFMAG